jgi:hypothetical protein
VDRRQGHLDDDRLDRILDTVADLTDDLASHDDVATDLSEAATATGFEALAAPENAKEATDSPKEEWRSPRAILCIPGSSKLDEAAAVVLAQMLQRRGFGVAAEKANALSMSNFFSLDISKARLICICYVERPSDAMIRYAVRRIIRKNNSSTVVLALLGDDGAGQADQVDGAARLFESFKRVVEGIVDVSRSHSQKPSREFGIAGPLLESSK